MGKFKIIGLEGASARMVVEAQFNPKEIHIQRSIPWQHQTTMGPSDLAYTVSSGRTMSCELLFDGFPTATSIQGDIDKLQTLSDVDAVLKRPPKVKVVWGTEDEGGLIPAFEAVIEVLFVKYLMFDPEAKPVRAMVELKFREAKNIKVGKTG